LSYPTRPHEAELLGDVLDDVEVLRVLDDERALEELDDDRALEELLVTGEIQLLS
jgi:hypothetical protein